MKALACLVMLTSTLASAACARASQQESHEHHAGHQSATVSARQAHVAAWGAHVMPFDLDRSTHVFARAADGGTQTVVSKDGAPDQVALIRQHLKEEAAAFATGDYSSPASIHGAGMPGLRELSRAGVRLQVTYEAIDRGARIRFESTDSAVVKALHAWFDAQVADHGNHAAHGHSH